MRSDDKKTKKSKKNKQKIAQKCIDCVIDGFQLEKPPKYVIIEPNFKEFFTATFTAIFKIVFKLNNSLKKLLYWEGFMIPSIMTPSVMSFHKLMPSIWCGVLDFSIKHPIIFGREGKFYHFGPYDKLKYKNLIFDRLEKLENEFPDLFPYKIIELDLFIELIQNIKYQEGTKDDFVLYNVKESKDSPKYLIDGLNQQKDLRNMMKKLSHSWYDDKNEIDVSTICIPYKEVTYFQIDAARLKKQCRAIHSLINALKEFH